MSLYVLPLIRFPLLLWQALLGVQGDLAELVPADDLGINAQEGGIYIGEPWLDSALQRPNGLCAVDDHRCHKRDRMQVMSSCQP